MARLSFLLLLAAILAPGRDLVRIPATSFDAVDETTGIKVRVGVGAFLISPTEVTQGEFAGIMGYNPSHYRGEELPVETVSWWEAIRYCNLRSGNEGLDLCYEANTGECDRGKNGYRLPTEAEWKVAAGDMARQAANLGARDTKRIGPLLDEVGKGTVKVASFPPNRFGLYDMLGNVWEWCNDYYDPTASYPQAIDPDGPGRGVARVIRGGSFATSATSWSKGYRSSMEPGSRSRFTGFRVVKTGAHEDIRQRAMPALPKAPQGFETATGGLSSLAGGIRTAQEWRDQAARLREKWMKLLGEPRVQPPAPSIRSVETFQEPGYKGTLAYLQVEPDFWEKIYILRPEHPIRRPVPVVIAPFYDVDAPAGKNMGGRRFSPLGVRSFAYLAAQAGFMAVAIRWFGESYGESYDEAVANLALRHPGCTGLGKWVWDARRLVDYIRTLPEADRGRIGIIGHSLGGKMALYAAALDDRIGVAVASEPGIGFGQSNYDDYWYLGEKLGGAPPGTDQHELLGLMAPRPFLLIGGDQYDGDKSWYYINSARQVYTLLGRSDRIAYLNHHTGHTPTPDAVWRAMEWLGRFLGE